MTTRALPLAPIAPSVRVECVPLKATFSARACLVQQRKRERRPLGCAGCPIGEAVRAGAGYKGPAPVAPEPVPSEPEAVPPPQRQPHRSAVSAIEALRALTAHHGTHIAACRAAGVSKTTGHYLLAQRPVGEHIRARFIDAARALPAAPPPVLCRAPGCGATASSHPTRHPMLEGLCLVHRQTARNALRYDRRANARLCIGCYAHRALRGDERSLCRECSDPSGAVVAVRAPLAGTRKPAATTNEESIAAWAARRAAK